MRAQAFENMLVLMERAIAREDTEELYNLRAKSIILRDRSDRSESVLREMINIKLD